MRDYIKVWRFHDAPEEFKNLSDNGGDEDWVALIPPWFIDEDVPWLDSGSFGCFCIDEYTHPDYPGYKIKIGCHA